jgi:shikimate dehydrogenase
VLVWNRTPQRAESLAQELGARAVFGPAKADLVVNCTSVGLQGEGDAFKALPLSADTVAAGSLLVDMVYRDGGTELTTAARRWGAEAVDGLEILVAQGAASFERWTGRPPDLRVMGEAAEEPVKR